MEGRQNLVPEQSLLQVEKALLEYLIRATIPSFGRCSWRVRQGERCQLWDDNDVERGGLEVGSR